LESPSHLQDHIDTILKHEQDFLAQRTSSERLGDLIASFVGSLSFVALHVVIASVWIILNTLSNTRSFHFDPYPFSLLGTCVSLEAILAASFIIMRQARLGRRADERDHLMLQILLLTEKEITAVVRMDQQIATRIGLTSIATDKDIKELSQQTSIDEVAQTIKENLPPG
jgi:uncharacterized membrane protein